MNIRKDLRESAEAGSRDEVRELAEALSLFRSAMHHVAERQMERQIEAPRTIPDRPAHRFRMKVLLAPALAAAVAAGVLLPIYTHEHHNSKAHTVAGTVEPSGATRASMDDTALMNQIDSAVSEDVPDALQPLVDLSEQITPSASEKKHATQE